MTEEKLKVLAEKIKAGTATKEEIFAFHKNINVLLSEIDESLKE